MELLEPSDRSHRDHDVDAIPRPSNGVSKCTDGVFGTRRPCGSLGVDLAEAGDVTRSPPSRSGEGIAPASLPEFASREPKEGMRGGRLTSPCSRSASETVWSAMRPILILGAGTKVRMRKNSAVLVRSARAKPNE